MSTVEELILSTNPYYFFKVLSKRRTGGFSSYQWPHSKVKTPNVLGPLEMCLNGYHLSTARGLYNFYAASVPSIWIAQGFIKNHLWRHEINGEFVLEPHQLPINYLYSYINNEGFHNKKVAFRQVKLIKRITPPKFSTVTHGCLGKMLHCKTEKEARLLFVDFINQGLIT